MSTSRSVNYNNTRNEIIRDSLELIGAYGVGQTISSEDQRFCENQLNRMVKAWQGKGIHLWAKGHAYLYPGDTANVGEFSLGYASEVHTTLQEEASNTQLTAAAVATDTVLTVEDTQIMAGADILGLVLADGTVHWTTIVSVGSTTSVTITDAVPSAANSGANVYSYTSPVNKPLRIQSMNCIRGMDLGATTTRTESPMTLLTQDEYFNLSIKTISGTPTHFYYQPQLDTGRLFLWPRPDSVSTYFEFTFDKILEDFDSALNTPDFPSEWLECIVYQLAYRIAPAFGKNKNMVQPEASSMLADMLDWDQEIGTVQIVPDHRGY